MNRNGWGRGEESGARGGRPGEEVSIIGLGASGTAAARLALAKGETVYVSDHATDARTSARAEELEHLGARVDLGHHDVARIAASRTVVVSPGIPPEAVVLQELRARDVRWLSEPEFAVRFYEGSLIAVTGTNGKTTTAALTAHLLEAAGVEAALGGNVGAALAPCASELALRERAPRWYVLEVSSFQLADTERFAPEIGVVTNLSPDHLDRYPDAEAYYADKAHLFRNARPGDRWVLNGDDPRVLALPGDAPGRRCLFSWGPPPSLPRVRGAAGASAYLREGVLTLRGEERSRELSLVPATSLALLGDHNVLNALAASLASWLAGAPTEAIREGLPRFRALPHRLEPLGVLEGVLWVNDSKATNVRAARVAVESLDRPLVVILGGTDKGEDFRPLAPVLTGRARAMVAYGQAGPRIARELREAWTGEGAAFPVPVAVEADFDAAVEAARARARAGDALLLAPACSSFDLFENYEARGRRFRELMGDGGEEGAP